MNRLISTLAGLMLIALGAVTLLSNIIMALFGINLAHYVAALVWAPLLLATGLLLVAAPLINRQQPSLGGLFIPGLPILAAGGVTLLATLMPWWHIWARLWPVVVLALAAGFVCLALHLRVIWIVIPAIFIGLNGLALQFCALTGLWGAWSVLWAVEPLGVGLTLLLTASQTRSTAVFVVGLIFCAFSSVVLTGLIVLLPGLWRLAGFASAGGLVLFGLVLIAWALFGPHRPGVSAASASPANQA
jgi:hypothetical protein